MQLNLPDRTRTKGVNMLERTCLLDERTTRYATVADFCGIFTEEMHSLYLLSFMLTADNHKAEQCFVSGMVACEQEIDAFMEWARTYARPAILKHAIRMIVPAPEHTDNFSYINFKGAATPGKNNLFGTIVALSGGHASRIITPDPATIFFALTWQDRTDYLRPMSITLIDSTTD